MLPRIRIYDFERRTSNVERRSAGAMELCPAGLHKHLIPFKKNVALCGDRADGLYAFAIGVDVDQLAV